MISAATKRSISVLAVTRCVEAKDFIKPETGGSEVPKSGRDEQSEDQSKTNNDLSSYERPSGAHVVQVGF